MKKMPVANSFLSTETGGTTTLVDGLWMDSGFFLDKGVSLVEYVEEEPEEDEDDEVYT